MEQREAYPGEEGVWRKQGEKGWRSLWLAGRASPESNLHPLSFHAYCTCTGMYYYCPVLQAARCMQSSAVAVAWYCETVVRSTTTVAAAPCARLALWLRGRRLCKLNSCWRIPMQPHGNYVRTLLKLPFSRKLSFLWTCVLISRFEACFREKASVNVFLLPKYTCKRSFREVGDSSEN